MIVYRYLGHPSDQGAHYRGVPARDLDVSDVADLTDEQVAAVRDGDLYAAVKAPTAPKPAAKPAASLSDGN
jgi:hypothetical protein